MKRNKNRKFKTKNRRVIRNQKIRAHRCFRAKNKSKCRKSLIRYQKRKVYMLYTLHWLIGESQKTPLGDFVNSINEKVNDLAELLEESYATMQKEYHEKELKINELHDLCRDEYENEYQKLLSEGYEHQEAYNVSNLRSIDESKGIKEHKLFDRNNTFSQLFFQSMLITLYSILESEISHVVKNKKLPIKFHYKTNTKELDFIKKILNGNGIEELRPFEYVSNLRLVRNSLVHNKSMLNPTIKDDHKTLVSILKEDSNCRLIKQGDSYELSINKIQFIRNYIYSIYVLINQVQWAIDKGDEFELLKSRLIFLLEISDNEVTIDSIIVNCQLKETIVDFEGLLPTHENSRYKGTLYISNKLDQDAKSMISFTNSIFDSLKSSDAISFLYNTTLKGFVYNELGQKVKLSLNIKSAKT
ncbi:MAG: hypothetical protein N4A74_25990 [Carboxylicivirga sp.]|jgi:hypothetical protein|nr:hypothetical protein [Carboxylicivirga sp.]